MTEKPNTLEDQILELAKTIPDEIQLCDLEGKPYDDPEDVIPLDNITKLTLAQLMIGTGDDLETVVNDVLKSAIERFDDPLDNDEDSDIMDETANEGELND